MKNKLYIILFFALVLTSCGEYEKILKSTDYAMKYDKAFEYFEKEDYVRASTVFDQISDIFRGTTKADTLQYYRAMSYYYQHDYLMAGHYFEQLAETFPNSEFSEESSYMNAYCYYKLSPRPSLDQENSYKGINSLTLYLIKYPDSEKRQECIRIISELREKLVEKSYISAKLYYDRELYKAAIVALRGSLQEFPDTKYREELMFLILQANYLLAENSVIEKKLERYQTTVDEYYSFVAEFEEGTHAGEAKHIYESSMSILGQEIN